MTKTVTLRLGKDVYEELREAAAAERRPLSNLIETAALARIREAQFVDDAEMAEILDNDALVRRLKAGSRQARRGKGHFVE
ncbi:MAG: ribbon-helix-helix protein, CopG family [Acidobacteriota bacterium]|nr:ribbon-helix-helix protein, CopG family [Acidobacteriota bacterium]